uniref:Inner membrane protein n=1 Tax=Macrostomum lignano TaxID=282301 RepID=A0A1I8GD28_9PLAT
MPLFEVADLRLAIWLATLRPQLRRQVPMWTRTLSGISYWLACCSLLVAGPLKSVAVQALTMAALSELITRYRNLFDILFGYFTSATAAVRFLIQRLIPGRVRLLSVAPRPAAVWLNCAS